MAAMFDFRAFLSTPLFPTTVFGVVVWSAGDLTKRDQAKKIDVSSEQGDLDWSTVAAKGFSFAHIKVTGNQ